jgi:hypothetical protein
MRTTTVNLSEIMAVARPLHHSRLTETMIHAFIPLRGALPAGRISAGK